MRGAMSPCHVALSKDTRLLIRVRSSGPSSTTLNRRSRPKMARAQQTRQGPATRPVPLPGYLHRISPFVCACFAPVCAYTAPVCAFQSRLVLAEAPCLQVCVLCLRGPFVCACLAPACACFHHATANVLCACASSCTMSTCGIAVSLSTP